MMSHGHGGAPYNNQCPPRQAHQPRFQPPFPNVYQVPPPPQFYHSHPPQPPMPAQFTQPPPGNALLEPSAELGAQVLAMLAQKMQPVNLQNNDLRNKLTTMSDPQPYGAHQPLIPPQHNAPPSQPQNVLPPQAHFTSPVNQQQNFAATTPRYTAPPNQNYHAGPVRPHNIPPSVYNPPQKRRKSNPPNVKNQIKAAAFQNNLSSPPPRPLLDYSNCYDPESTQIAFYNSPNDQKLEELPIFTPSALPVLSSTPLHSRSARLSVSPVPQISENDELSDALSEPSTRSATPVYEAEESLSDSGVSSESEDESPDFPFETQCKEGAYPVSQIPFIDSHCHIDYIFVREKHYGSFNSYIKTKEFPKNFSGCIANFCDPAAWGDQKMYESVLEEDGVWGAFGERFNTVLQKIHLYTSGLNLKIILFSNILIFLGPQVYILTMRSYTMMK